MKIIFAIFCLLATVSISGAQNTGKMPINIAVAGSTGSEARVKSLIARELRAIGDVEIEEKPNAACLTLGVIVTEPKTKAGNSAGGYVMSVAVSNRMYLTSLAFCQIPLPSGFGPEKIKQITDKFPANGVLVDHFVIIMDRHSLEETCKDIVSKIDINHIENLRQLRKQVLEKINNEKQ